MKKITFNLIMQMLLFASCTNTNVKTEVQIQQDSIERNITINIPQKEENSVCNNKVIENTPVQMLTEFYTLYITENSKLVPNVKEMEALYKRYLTAELQKKLKEVFWDYDPFLKAQDCEKKWIKTLEFISVPELENVYRVCYSYDGEHTNCITLFVTKINDHYLINDIDDT